MKLLVLGSTGATGQLVTASALARGHDLTLLVRDPTRIENTGASRIVVGDARSAEDLADAMAGVDATISTLGLGLGTKSNGLIFEATCAIVDAAHRTGSLRLVMLSSFGVGETLARASLPFRLLYQAGKAVHDDKAQGEVLLRASDLHWTLAYPVGLTNARISGYTARDLAAVTRVPGMPRIGRAAVAEFLLDTAEAGTWLRSTVVLTQNA